MNGTESPIQRHKFFLGYLAYRGIRRSAYLNRQRTTSHGADTYGLAVWVLVTTETPWGFCTWVSVGTPLVWFFGWCMFLSALMSLAIGIQARKGRHG